MVIHTTTPTLLDKLIYDAANKVPGTWAVDVDQDTDEPLRVRSDFAPYRYGWSVASVIKGDTPEDDSYVGSGRSCRRAIRALKLAHDAYFKHQKDRERWGIVTDSTPPVSRVALPLTHDPAAYALTLPISYRGVYLRAIAGSRPAARRLRGLIRDLSSRRVVSTCQFCGQSEHEGLILPHLLSCPVKNRARRDEILRAWNLSVFCLPNRKHWPLWLVRQAAEEIKAAGLAHPQQTAYGGKK